MKTLIAFLLASLGLPPSTHASLLSDQQEANLRRQIDDDPFTTVKVDNGMPIGTTDRFEGGLVPPVGIGVEDRDFGSILSAEEVVSGLSALAATYPEYFYNSSNMADTTAAEWMYAGSIGKSPQAMMISGVHPRERGGPDFLLYFVADLLYAFKNGVGLQYGKMKYSIDEVEVAFKAGIAIIPLMNPDGVAWDQKSNDCWRKNRNDLNATDELSIGVDLNRNFPFLWDFLRYFDPRAPRPASNDPSSPVFHGTKPASESEIHAFNAFWVRYRPSVKWFLDLHSFGSQVLYGWGHDNLQTENITMSFWNRTYWGSMGLVNNDGPGEAFKEWMDPYDHRRQKTVAKQMARMMSKAGSLKYQPMEAVRLYATSGTSTDWVMSQYYSRVCGQPLVGAVTVEFGADSGLSCPFYPTNEQYHQSMRQVGAGLMEFMLTAGVDFEETVRYVCSEEDDYARPPFADALLSPEEYHQH